MTPGSPSPANARPPVPGKPQPPVDKYTQEFSGLYKSLAENLGQLSPTVTGEKLLDVINGHDKKLLDLNAQAQDNLGDDFQRLQKNTAQAQQAYFGKRDLLIEIAAKFTSQ